MARTTNIRRNAPIAARAAGVAVTATPQAQAPAQPPIMPQRRPRRAQTNAPAAKTAPKRAGFLKIAALFSGLAIGLGLPTQTQDAAPKAPDIAAANIDQGFPAPIKVKTVKILPSDTDRIPAISTSKAVPNVYIKATPVKTITITPESIEQEKAKAKAAEEALTRAAVEKAAAEKAAKEKAEALALAEKQKAEALAEAERKAEEIKNRPLTASFADALKPQKLFPVRGWKIPNGRRISLKDRYRMSAATMKAEKLEPESILAWHGDQPITVETVLRHPDIWRLPQQADLPNFKACLEKHGFENSQMVDLKHVEKRFHLPSGIMNAIYAGESSGYQCTQSWTNARGPLQIMAITERHMRDTYNLKSGNMYNLEHAIEITARWLKHYSDTYKLGRFSDDKRKKILMAFYVQGPRDVVPNITKNGDLIMANLTADAQKYVPGSNSKKKDKDTKAPDTADSKISIVEMLFGKNKAKGPTTTSALAYK